VFGRFRALNMFTLPTATSMMFQKKKFHKRLGSQ
jgi:hypothetical protein